MLSPVRKSEPLLSLLRQTWAADIWARVVNAWGLLSDSSPLVFTGGLFNESRDSLGLREVDGVAALGLNHRGAKRWDRVAKLYVAENKVRAQRRYPHRLSDYR